MDVGMPGGEAVASGDYGINIVADKPSQGIVVIQGVDGNQLVLLQLGDQFVELV